MVVPDRPATGLGWQPHAESRAAKLHHMLQRNIMTVCQRTQGPIAHHHPPNKIAAINRLGKSNWLFKFNIPTITPVLIN
jgi:hypothetical protein